MHASPAGVQSSGPPSLAPQNRSKGAAEREPPPIRLLFDLNVSDLYRFSKKYLTKTGLKLILRRVLPPNFKGYGRFKGIDDQEMIKLSEEGWIIVTADKALANSIKRIGREAIYIPATEKPEKRKTTLIKQLKEITQKEWGMPPAKNGD